MSYFFNLHESQMRRVTRKLGNREKAQFLLFRVLGPAFQKRVADLVNMEGIPRVFIHGNPHLDNYAKTPTGAGLVDFDRSRIGPYAWDIVRFYASLAWRREASAEFSLPPEVYDAFKDGYLSRLYDADLFYQTPSIMSGIVPTSEELTVKSYCEAKRKWAKKMRQSPIAVDDTFIRGLLDGYISNSKQHSLLTNYKLARAGTAVGSLGKVHFILQLTPIEGNEKYDDILLDIKETYTEEDDEWFSNPSDHHGLRMIKASMLYAPGVESRLSYCTKDGVQYWGREIPAFKGKLPDLLNEFDLMDVAFCIGTQLGRGHRRSCKNLDPKTIEKHFGENQASIEQLAQWLNKELLLGFEFIEKSAKLEQEISDVSL